MDYSPPGSSLHGILQARILDGVAINAKAIGNSHFFISISPGLI